MSVMESQPRSLAVSRAAGAGVVLVTVLCWLMLSAGVLAGEAHDIEIEEHRLHIECSGQGAPTVILDAGLGGTALEWVFVIERLQAQTQICTYDRAGYGGSDLGPLPRTSARIAHELAQLLVRARIAPPYVLVGHSFGGYNMQMFARRYPGLTAALVLLDASHPDQVERFAAPPLNMVTAPSSRAGIVQFRELPQPILALPPLQRQLALERAARWKTRRTVSAELLSFRDSAAEVRAAPPLGALPLVVISRGRSDEEATPKRVLFEQIWLELQTDLAANSSASAHLLARNSGHHIHLEQPDLVAFAIGLVVARTRGPAAVSHWAETLAVRTTDGEYRLRGTTWLKDDLSLYPRPALAATSCARACASTASGAP